MKSIARRKRLLRVGARAVHELWAVDTCALRGCVADHGLLGSLLRAPRACIDSKLRSRTQTSGCSLVQLCSSPDKCRIGPRCTWCNGSVGRVEFSALRTDHIRFRGLHGARVPRKTRRFNYAPPPRGRSLPQRMAGREDQRSPVLEVKRQARVCCDSWRLLAVAQLRVGERCCGECHEALLEWQMPYVCDVP